MKHTHSHSHSPVKKLWWVFALSLTYMVAEIIGGLLSESLALLADAGHMAIDTAGIGLGLFAAWIATKPPSSKKTFGYYRAEILAALINGAFLISASVWILFQAWDRFTNPHEVKGALMSWIALGGLLVNLIGAKLLHAHSHDNLNLRGVWLHLISDLLGSVSAVGAGLLVWKFGWQWADPLSSIFISLLILVGAWKLVSEAVHVLLDGVPHELETTDIKAAMNEVSGVSGVFDLHIWTIASGVYALSAHVALKDGASHTGVLSALGALLKERFSITHTTIQLEPEDYHHEEAHSDHCELGQPPHHH
ncbi:MAG: cation transporter [Proteobacteria bacterium]|nr:cation transporter [Pseudomonadota bacterium]NDD05446.1 cation transporter [Pseudomonadota bacterium]